MRRCTTWPAAGRPWDRSRWGGDPRCSRLGGGLPAPPHNAAASRCRLALLQTSASPGCHAWLLCCAQSALTVLEALLDNNFDDLAAIRGDPDLASLRGPELEQMLAK